MLWNLNKEAIQLVLIVACFCLQRSRLLALMLGLVYTTDKGQGCLPLMLGLVYTTCKGQGCLSLMLGLVYTTCKGQGCLPLCLVWFTLINFSLIAMEAVLHTKQQSNLFLEPTSTAQ